jgi:RNA polymerase primary sigma factor
MRQLKLTNSIANRDSDSVDRYLLEISKKELLSAQEEAQLAKLSREGDIDALDKLVQSNLRFVVSVAKQYQNQGLSLNDLINEGNLGLIRAAQKFDETRGFKFISYAVWWIRQAMAQAIIEQSKIIRIPTGKVQNFSKINKAFQMLEQEYMRDPSIEDVMIKTGLSEEDINEYLKNIVSTVSTDAGMRGEEGELTYGDTLHDDSHLNPEDDMMRTSVEGMLTNMLATLDKREKEIITLYFGLDGYETHTLEEIGTKLELTRERVRQIKERCLERLKKRSNISLLDSYPLK